MKKTLFLFAIICATRLEASAQDTLTVSQMREDYTYMMEQYERIHPNPTWSLGEERYSELKQQTLAQLDHPMTQLDFWKVIARWNQYFDGHTHVGWPTTTFPMGMMAFPPKSIVQYRDKKVYFSAYDAIPDSLRGCEITAVNGHPTAEIIDSIMPYISHESDMHISNTILRTLFWFYQTFYGCDSQMVLHYQSASNKQCSISLNRRMVYSWLVQIGDLGEIGGTGLRDRPWSFQLFLKQGIALFEFNACGPNDKYEQFDTVVANYIDSINHYGIRHLFVDISHNVGGNDAFCRYFLRHVAGLPDTMVVMDITNTEMGTIQNPEERRITMSFVPKQPQYSGKLYFIQSHFTYSAAIFMANLAKQYRLGAVIGEETSGLTTTYIRHNPVRLPNSGLTFYCSDKQNRYFGTTGPRGVMPDIPFEIGYKYLFRSFTVDELQQFLKE
ncbi:MAG: hypothetical protein IJ634_02805 [Bacteroidales bacterium]|nr:hypothetical protein [Bacteroidales bacterium]